MIFSADEGFCPLFFCGIRLFFFITIKCYGTFLLTPPAETISAISTVADRTVGRNCTHGRKTLSVLSARFVIQNVWRSVHDICWSVSLQCEAYKASSSTCLDIQQCSLEFSVLWTRYCVFGWVGLGVAEDPSAFILKGQAVHDDLTLEGEGCKIFRKVGYPKPMTQIHIPAYPKLFLCCMGVVSSIVAVAMAIIIIIIIQDKIII